MHGRFPGGQERAEHESTRLSSLRYFDESGQQRILPRFVHVRSLRFEYLRTYDNRTMTSALAIGVDLGATKIATALVARDGTVVASRHAPTLPMTASSASASASPTKSRR